MWRSLNLWKTLVSEEAGDAPGGLEPNRGQLGQEASTISERSPPAINTTFLYQISLLNSFSKTAARDPHS